MYFAQNFHFFHSFSYKTFNAEQHHCLTSRDKNSYKMRLTLVSKDSQRPKYLIEINFGLASSRFEVSIAYLSNKEKTFLVRNLSIDKIK